MPPVSEAEDFVDEDRRDHVGDTTRLMTRDPGLEVWHDLLVVRRPSGGEAPSRDLDQHDGDEVDADELVGEGHAPMSGFRPAGASTHG